MSNLITITAANNQRHFYLNDANAKLILRYLKLVGGDVSSSNPDRRGGAICIWYNGGKLELYFSILVDNDAKWGGAISAFGLSANLKLAHYFAANCNLEVVLLWEIVQCHIHGDIATTEGAGMYIAYSEVMIDNVTMSENSAGFRGGGAHMYGSLSSPSNVNITQSIIKNNKITTHKQQVPTEEWFAIKL